MEAAVAGDTIVNGALLRSSTIGISAKAMRISAVVVATAGTVQSKEPVLLVADAMVLHDCPPLEENSIRTGVLVQLVLHWITCCVPAVSVSYPLG